MCERVVHVCVRGVGYGGGAGGWGEVNSEGTFINDVNARIPVTFSVKYASQYRSGVFFEGGTHTFQSQPINHRLYNFIFGSFFVVFFRREGGGGMLSHKGNQSLIQQPTAHAKHRSAQQSYSCA